MARKSMKQADTVEVRHIFARVAGVNHKNNDGTGRQIIIRRCQVMEELTLAHEENNPIDPNSVAIRRKNGEQIGYLRSELAEEVVSRLRRGYKYATFIKDISSLDPSSGVLGVNLLIIEAEPGVGAKKVRKYTNALDLGLKPKSGWYGKFAVALMVIGLLAYLVFRFWESWG